MASHPRSPKSSTLPWCRSPCSTTGVARVVEERRGDVGAAAMERSEAVGLGEQVAEPGRQVHELGRVVRVEHRSGCRVDPVGGVADDPRRLVVLAALGHAHEVAAARRALEQHRRAVPSQHAGGAVPVEGREQVGAADLLLGVRDLEHRGRVPALGDANGHERARRRRDRVAVGAQPPPSEPGGLPGVAGVHGTEVAHDPFQTFPAHGS